MRLNRAAEDGAQTAGVVRRRLGASAIRVLSVTAVAAATCSLWAGAASAATAAPAAGTTTTTTITNANPGTVHAGDAYTIDVTVAGGGGTPTGTVTVAPSDATLPPSYSCKATLTAEPGRVRSPRAPVPSGTLTTRQRIRATGPLPVPSPVRSC